MSSPALRAAVSALVVTLVLTACGGSAPGQSRKDDGLIPVSGGVQELAGVGSITFPAGAFEEPTAVTITTSSEAELLEAYQHGRVIHQAVDATPFAVLVGTGGNAPQADVQVTLSLPPGFTIAADNAPALFARLWQEGEDRLYNFELFPSTWNPASKTVSATVQKEAFTNLHRSDGTFEGAFLLATVPAPPASTFGQGPANGASLRPLTSHEPECEGSSFGPPLNGTLTVIRHFNRGGTPHPITGATTPHRGVDLRAADGSDVLAVANGEITRVAYQFNQTRRTGWGHYIVLKHEGGSVLYAHLEDGSLLVNVGDQVVKGQKIANSDSSGGVTGPHLHFEYAPDGRIFTNASKVDPYPCFTAAVPGLPRTEANADNQPEVVSEGTAAPVDAAATSTTGGSSAHAQLGQVQAAASLHTSNVSPTIASHNASGEWIDFFTITPTDASLNGGVGSMKVRIATSGFLNRGATEDPLFVGAQVRVRLLGVPGADQEELWVKEDEGVLSLNDTLELEFSGIEFGHVTALVASGRAYTAFAYRSPPEPPDMSGTSAANLSLQWLGISEVRDASGNTIPYVLASASGRNWTNAQ